MAGGYFIQEAIALVDLARYLGGEVRTVFAMAVEGTPSERHPDRDIEDALISVLRFRSGAAGEIVTANATPARETMISVLADGIEIRITPDSFEIVEPGACTQRHHTGDALRATQETFLEAVQSGSTGGIRSDYGDAVRTLEVALAALESARSGKVVTV